MIRTRKFVLGLGIAGLLSLTALPGAAVRFPNGSVAFEKSPRLLGAVTTFKKTDVPSAKYYFTVAIPADAGEPLGAITIAQRSGQEQIDLRADRTFAFVGTPGDRGERLNLRGVDYDPETDTISVAFASGIPPGTTFTLGLLPGRNPRFSGVYLFGVTVFPEGENPRGLYLGPGRLQFERGDGSFD